MDRYDKNIFTPPFRLGRKQNKAVLDSNGKEVVIFPDNSPIQAQLFVDYLNELDKTIHPNRTEALTNIKEFVKNNDKEVIINRLNHIQNNINNSSNSNKDWVEDFEHENGNYTNRCVFCKELFSGHKRRVVCKECDDNRCL